MRRYRTVVALAACAVILVLMGTMSLNCMEKISHGGPLSQKLRVHASPCPRDSLTSPSTTGVVALSASAPVVPDPMPVRYAAAINSVCTAMNPSIEAPPFRC